MFLFLLLQLPAQVVSLCSECYFCYSCCNDVWSLCYFKLSFFFFLFPSFFSPPPLKLLNEVSFEWYSGISQVISSGCLEYLSHPSCSSPFLSYHCTSLFFFLYFISHIPSHKMLYYRLGGWNVNVYTYDFVYKLSYLNDESQNISLWRSLLDKQVWFYSYSLA